MQSLDAEDRLFIFQIVSCGTYLILAIAFVFIGKDSKRFRFAPLVLLLCSQLIYFVPGIRFSDHRSQWHQTAAMIPYGLLYFGLGFWLFRSKAIFRQVFGFASFMAGMSFLSVAITLLCESWYFYQVLLRHN